MLSSNHLPSGTALLQAFSTSPKSGRIHVGKGARKDKQETSLKTNSGHCESLRYKTQPPGSCFALFSASLCRVEQFSDNRDGGTMCFARQQPNWRSGCLVGAAAAASAPLKPASCLLPLSSTSL